MTDAVLMVMAHDYMLKAISDIDELLGKGYAKQHPELIAAYIQTAAIDFGTAIIARPIEGVPDALEGIGRALNNLDNSGNGA